MTTIAPNTNYLSVGGSTEFNSGARIHGTRRRVLVVVDPTDAVEELDEYAQSMSIDIDTPVRTGFDLSLVAGIQQVGGQYRIYFTVRNHGNVDSPGNMPVTFKVAYGSAAPFATVSQLLPSIPAGCDPVGCVNADCSDGSCETGECVTRLCDYYIEPASAIAVTGLPRDIRATIELPSFNDLDSVNDTFEARLDYVTWAEVDVASPTSVYGALLNANGGAIKNVLRWPPGCPGCPFAGYVAPSPISFDSWSETGEYGSCTWPGLGTAYACPTKERLSDFLLALEQGREFPMLDPLSVAGVAHHPPPPVQGWDVYGLTDTSAVDVYLAHVAQALWFEVHGEEHHGLTDPNWSLGGLAGQRLSETPLNPDQLFQVDAYGLSGPGQKPVYTASEGYGGVSGYTTAWNPRVLYRFLDAQGAIGPTQADTVGALTDWWRTHSRHGNSTDHDNPMVDWGFPGSPPADKVYYPLVGRGHAAVYGCGSASSNWQRTLLAVNIIALPTVTGYDDGIHATIQLPAVRKPCGGSSEPECCPDPPCCEEPPCADDAGIILAHADDLYSHPYHIYANTYGLSEHVPPWWTLWYSLEENDWFLDGTFPGSTETECACLTPGKQMYVNSARYQLLWQSEYPAGEWPRLRYCEETCDALRCNTANCASRLEDALTTGAIPAEPVPVAIFDSLAKAAFREKLDIALSEIGSSGPFGVDWLDARNTARSRSFSAPSGTAGSPIAVAGPDRTAYPGSCVTLDAFGSTAPPSAGYVWSVCTGANCETVIPVAEPTARRTTFVAPMTTGTVTAKLTVGNGVNQTVDTAIITVVDPGTGAPLTVVGEGPRYLAITPSGDEPVAIEVTSDATGFDCMKMFVQPVVVSGQTRYELIETTNPVFLTPAQWCTAYVSDEDIMPLKEYDVRILYQDDAYSPSASGSTWKWGDVNNDNAANFVDVSAITAEFQGVRGAGSVLRYDLQGRNPNRVIDFIDVSAATSAFQGLPFPHGIPVYDNDLACDDGLYCNGAEVCVNKVCVAGTAPNCSDGIACTVDACNEASDACSHTANHTACNDGLYCTIDTCNVSTGCTYAPRNCPLGQTCNEALDTCTTGGPD